MPRKRLPITSGQLFGRWKILKELPKVNNFRTFLCECSCDAKTQKAIRLSSLTTGRSTSCGCYQKALAAIQAKARFTKKK